MKKFTILMSLLLLQASVLFSVGAGLGIYRFNKNNELEFLLVQDPYQSQSWRQGFEFPAGTIGDHGHTTIDQLDGAMVDRLSEFEKKRMSVKRFLRGAIREALEELVFVPATKIIPGNPYSGSKINKEFERKAINAVVHSVEKHELICLRNIQGRSNYTIFFWDVTNLSSQKWLQQIQSQRQHVLSQPLSRVSTIGAEPDSFAWVSAQELRSVILRAQKEKNMNRVQDTYYVTASELVQLSNSLQRNIPIRISSAMVGLISRSVSCAENHDNQKTLKMLDLIDYLQKNRS